jgi:E3 ubiquitin-protein ligase RNF1/2
MNDNDGGKDSSSDDGLTETQPRRCKRGGEQEAQAPQQSASTDPDGVGEENTPEVNRDIISASGTLSWGKNGHRSHNRVNGKNAKSNRLSKLVEHLRSTAANDYEVNIFLRSDFLFIKKMFRLGETQNLVQDTTLAKIYNRI